LTALQTDEVLRRALGPVIVDHYPRVKRFEAELAERAARETDDDGAAWQRWCWLEAV
jgi:hypothetical protein